MGALPDSVTKEISATIMSETRQAMERHKINADSLIRALKRELKAKVSKTLKFKGKVEIDKETGKPILAKGMRILAQGEKREISGGEDHVAYDDGDTVVGWEEIAWEIQQKARMDAQKLLEMYPVEKKHIQFDEATLNAILTGLPAGVGEAVRAELSGIISKKRD